MNIQELKTQFKQQEITKSAFIDQMFDFHKVLFDFSSELQNTEIASIELSDDKVVFVSRETEYHTGGVKFIADVKDKRITPLEAFNFGVYEQSDSEMLYKLLEPDNVIFDIGANIGWYTNHIARKFPESVVYAFEPIPETFKQLSDNISLNAAGNVKLNNFAFSNEKQTLTFYYSPLQTGASSSQNITDNDNMIKLDCQATTIDIFVGENNISALDFIKCDVEGAELYVYQGAVATLEKYKPVVFTEMLRKWSAKFGYHPNDIISFYKALGYNCFSAENGQLVSFATVDDNTMETNFFFLHEKKHASKIAEFAKA